MVSTLSQETIHVGELHAYDIVHVAKIESLERVGVSSRIGVRCLGAAICGVDGRPLFCDTGVVNRAIAGRAWNAA